MAIRKVKLSDTQARVIGGAVLTGGMFTAYAVGRASRATFRKLFDLGLTDQPWAGSRLTLEGVNVRTSLETDLLQRSFHISSEISHGAYAALFTHKLPLVSTAGEANEPEETPSVEWHVSVNGKWSSISYQGYAPVNIRVDGMYESVDYRHRASECTTENCVGSIPAETFAVTVLRVNGEGQVHRTGCRDIKLSVMRGNTDDPWDLTVASELDLAEQVWSDVSSDDGPVGSPEWWEALDYNYSSMRRLPCVPKMPRGEWQS